ncbi:MAG: asparaginase [Rubrivivax sp. SCN 71-131]|jgi:L-asparaginase II|nr:MAG: asparaginase [Rubrivivax sp. SCN 71-131]
MMHDRADPILVQATRGGIVESFHRGALAVVDAGGGLVLSMGEIERPIFPRSAIKLLQALPLVASGAAEALALNDEELALACASHSGEEAHARTAAGMLAKAGVDASVLECGVHWPYDEDAQRELVRRGEPASVLHNNCSGKHSGFVCLACRMNGDQPLRGFLSGYVQPEHPVMREVSAALQAATGWDLSKSARGIDGCSIPAHAVPLRHLALAYARVASGQGLSPQHARAAKRLRQAVARAPFFTSGTGKFDARVNGHFGERVYCKVGAEGVHCAALPQLGLGIAIKMDDGNNSRACEVVLAALLHRLLPPADVDAAFLGGLSDQALRNRNRIEVGRLQAAAALASA